MNKTRVITLARLRKLEPCADQYAIVARLYPSGVPLTTEAMAALEAAGVDTMWAGLRLLTAKQRSAFVIFTLRQRGPRGTSRVLASGCGCSLSCKSKVPGDDDSRAVVGASAEKAGLTPRPSLRYTSAHRGFGRARE